MIKVIDFVSVSSVWFFGNCLLLILVACSLFFFPGRLVDSFEGFEENKLQSFETDQHECLCLRLRFSL